MAKKKRSIRRHYRVPFLLMIGVLVSIIFMVIYGGLMLLRYALGALMFATLTSAITQFIRHKFGKKVIIVGW